MFVQYDISTMKTEYFFNIFFSAILVRLIIFMSLICRCEELMKDLRKCTYFLKCMSSQNNFWTFLRDS